MADRPVPIEVRLRSWVPDVELQAKVGRIVTERDYNLLCTGPVRLYGPRGNLLGVYLPGVLRDQLADAWDVLSGIRMLTDNRGAASGTLREQRGDQKRTRTRRIMSSVIGAVDPGPSTARAGGRLPACRLTAWTGKHAEQWHGLAPVFDAIAHWYHWAAPMPYIRQAEVAAVTDPAWLIGATPFTTVTVNNTYSTGVHQDAGDLPQGFSTLAVARRGAWTGGHLVWPEYRVAFAMGDGDLLVFDAHQWHGNTAMHCPHQPGPLARPCTEGCERVSLVTYYRTRVQHCGTAEAEAHKATMRAAEGYGA